MAVNNDRGAPGLVGGGDRLVECSLALAEVCPPPPPGVSDIAWIHINRIGDQFLATFGKVGRNLPSVMVL